MCQTAILMFAFTLPRVIYCQTDPCATNPCQNSATCEPAPFNSTFYQCKTNCPSNYYGQKCEANVTASSVCTSCPDDFTQAVPGSCFAVSSGTYNFTDAVAYCISVGGTLATVYSYAEDYQIRRQLTDLGTTIFYWIGLGFPSSYSVAKWADGSNSGYKRTTPATGKCCAVKTLKTIPITDNWSSTSCTEKYGAICRSSCASVATTEEPTTEEPTTEEPTTEDLTTQDPTTQEPTTEDLTTQDPTTQEPTTEEPTTEDLTTQDPTTQEPTTEDLTTQDPMTQEPTTEDLTTQDPTTEDLTTQDPTTQEPTTEEPTTKEPTTEDLTTQDPTTHEPTTEEPTTQDPTTEDPTTQDSTTDEPTMLTTTLPETSIVPTTLIPTTTITNGDPCIGVTCSNSAICTTSQYNASDYECKTNCPANHYGQRCEASASSSAVCQACPKDYSQNVPGSCFTLMTMAGTQSEGVSNCNQVLGNITSINTKSEEYELRSKLNFFPCKECSELLELLKVPIAWIGYGDPSGTESFAWADGSTSTYTLWDGGRMYHLPK
uniref:C-type lectin domain-containing protein n=1 Tax=Plectus sambesii TaxID=2011161 RepID=A0A914WI13_9BILA